ncbi:MAG: inorganic phosphate transporter [Bacteroidales bacterium]|nr:inorganic phosphate transporter [Bacteroidales bacterium]
METLFLVIVGILFLLAISDLIVGVSNDAVNFLNSAIGSKAASFKFIMFIAAIGVLVGAVFSSGMMEVARKGIMNPQYFTFWGVMVIFLAVMITDVILLDTFNTFGFPTSTTVSIVFELLGASVAVSYIMTLNDHMITLENGTQRLAQIADLINSAKAMQIIGGILLSVVVAFSVGAFVQYITRIIFSFDYEKGIKRYGGIFGGIAITAITYFILIKGAKGAAFMSADIKSFIKDNTLMIIGISLVSWTIILQILNWVANINILKFIVFIGTFSLAMAFAGNDLVNFIGVPIAGFQAYEIFNASNSMDPASFIMADLAGKVATPTLFLIGAGIVMVITLYTSKKAKAVVKTSIDLSRQDEGEERFGSSMFARSIVHASRNMGIATQGIFPESLKNKIKSRFDQTAFNQKVAELGDDAPAFDMLRAAVNLIVASILISFATSMKLPLSTTYVTFMVAMGTSLADKAWGRESAVYRITGVFSVIGGWFFTAFAAFTVAFIVALIIYWGQIYAIVGLIGIAVLFMYRTHTAQKKRTEIPTELVSEHITDDNIIATCTNNVSSTLIRVSKLYEKTILALSTENLKELKQANKDVKDLNKNIKILKDNVSNILQKIDADSLEKGHYYVQVLDYMREVAHNMTFIVRPSHDHVDNNHKPILETQVAELSAIIVKVKNVLKKSSQIIKFGNFETLDEYLNDSNTCIKTIASARKEQIKRVKKSEAGTKNTMLYLNILNESKNLILHVNNMVKAQRDFTIHNDID